MASPLQPSRIVAVALAVWLAAGCVPPPQAGLRDADVSLPARYLASTDAGDSAALPVIADAFADPQLVQLIDEALDRNQELGIVRQEVQIARAEVRARRGEVLPRVGLGVHAGQEKVGRYTSQGASDASTDIEPGREVPEYLGELRVGFEATWEVDVWRKLRNAAKAARLRYLASIEGQRFVRTGVVAEVANAYYELMALDNELQVVQAYVDLLQRSLEVVRLQKQAARVTELAVQRFEAELHANEARLFEVRQRIVEAENELHLRCGRYPQAIDRASASFHDVDLPALSTGVPVALLEQRPDVRAAELELEAAKLDVKVARALFYPSLDIDARLGLEAFSARRLATLPASLLVDVSGRLLAPLLNRKAIQAEYATANAKQLQAVLDYERTVLRAYLEVATQLANIGNQGQMYARRTQQVERLERAVETSTGLFRSARADYLEVLTTRRDALESQLELIETRRAQLGARVDLYRALGGGWQPAEEARP